MDWTYHPARDIASAPQERLKSIDRVQGILSSLIGTLWWTLVSVLMRVWHRFEVTGRENFPQQGPFVVISNHASHLDIASLMSALPFKHRDVFTLAAEDYFFSRPLTSLLMAMTVNALPLSRGSSIKGYQSLAAVRRRLIEEHIGIIFYPEGTRTRSGDMGRFRRGIGSMVAGTSIPVVPCFIEGAYKAWPAGKTWPSPKRVRVIVGKPLVFSHVSTTAQDSSEVAAQLEDAVRALGTTHETVEMDQHGHAL